MTIYKQVIANNNIYALHESNITQARVLFTYNPQPCIEKCSKPTNTEEYDYVFPKIEVTIVLEIEYLIQETIKYTFAKLGLIQSFAVQVGIRMNSMNLDSVKIGL